MITLIVKSCMLFAALVLVYYVVPKKFQWCVLLLANIVFYLRYGIKFFPYIIFTIVTTYAAGIILEKINDDYKETKGQHTQAEDKKAAKKKYIHKKQLVLLVTLLLNMGIWAVLKYTAYIFGNVNEWFALANPLPIPAFVMPIGISYYTFVSAGYCIDIYRDKYKAERNLGRYTLFISFFLHILQGPFSRFNMLKTTLFEKHAFSFERIYNGGLRILFGLFKKFIIADYIGNSVVYIYENYASLNGIYALLLIVFLSIELYADFSGYMDIINGAATMLGIRNQENFTQPFFAKSIEEFWRRWHITLGVWFKDYLFYPVSMSKWAQKLGQKSRKLVGNTNGRMIPSYIALVFVWTVTGIWHGCALQFLLWGWMNLFFIAFGMMFGPLYHKLHDVTHISAESKGWKLFAMLRTFFLFGCMEVMSDAGSAGIAFTIYRKLFTGWDLSILTSLETLFPEVPEPNACLIILGVLMMLVVDIVKEKNISLKGFLLRMPVLVRYTLYLGMVYILILFTARVQSGGGFMYANF